MKPLRWLVVIIFLILTAVTGTIVLHGRGLPEVRTDQLQAMGVDTCEGKLCFMNVVPGVTTWSEAHKALADYITRDEGDHFHGQVGDYEIRVEGGWSDDTITRVDVQNYRNMRTSPVVQFKEVIAQFGTPCYVSVSGARIRGLTLTYPTFRLSISTEERRLSLDSPIQGITLVDVVGSNGNLCAGGATSGIPWRGFASVELYEALEGFDR
jgi:hypothetical protein